MKIKNLTTLALFAALSIVLSLFSIKIMGNALQITFTFIVSMIVASKYSLKECVIYAIVVDVLGFIITNQGDVFFPGYTLSAVLGLIIYWTFLHKEVSLKNIIISKTLVNLIVNVAIGSIWRAMLYSKGYLYYLSTSLVKNITLLPIEIIIFYCVYKLLSSVIKNSV